MNYHKILLGILMPVTFFCNGNETQIKELKDARYKKELELSELGSKIAEKDRQIRSYHAEVSLLVSKLIQKKELSEEEEREEMKAIIATLNAFFEEFNRVLTGKNDIKEFLIKKLFKIEDQELDKFDTERFFVIRTFNETNLVKTLVEKYADVQRELHLIDLALNKLINNTTQIKA